jgi:DNA adenine methylase
VIRSFMGFGSNAHSSTQRGHQSTGFRSNSNRSGTTPAQDWQNLPDAYGAIVERMRGVVIEHRDALDRADSATMARRRCTTSTRPMSTTPARCSRAASLPTSTNSMGGGIPGCSRRSASLAGMVVLSGYANPLYDEALHDWRRIEFAAHADGARPRTEVLWINPAAPKPSIERSGRFIR